ncbi:aldo/keto reductase [Streptomyces viridochromogenes]|uniref:Aldo/keto reductase n=1 Tax=Streptomyces viridochromogenes TaxID=1938 RepID=A0A0J7Z047_STRVR|nr:aldo/keto reductase [Streptomyces viridochromogenes]KMS69341.1 aldo/keto reductase [Streptomyces viridochromogenes]KOG11068.1 aldo/keto reductase [Streptomyces viridochromogenes]KOG12260.1 aldo/keto reductase [Streptomyces viridochromogenes]
MRYRELGRTGLTVSEIGYGAWGLGQGAWVGADDDSGVRALHRALDLGVTFIDTARAYDRSESVVGRALRELPGGGDGVHVATKVGPKVPVSLSPSGLDPMEAFPGSHLRESLQTSLRELGRDHVDLLQLHTWEDEWTGRGDWLETVDALKQEGRIRSFGISVKDHQPENVLTVLRTGVVDTVQVIYNVFEQAPADALLPACEEYGVGVIVRVALDEGALTGSIRTGVTFPEGDWRNWYFRDDRPAQVGKRVDAICADLGIGVEELPSTALRFALAGQAVSTVIVGMRSLRNVERNAAIADAPPLTPRRLAQLAEHRWAKNFYS